MGPLILSIYLYLLNKLTSVPATSTPTLYAAGEGRRGKGRKEGGEKGGKKGVIPFP